MRSTVPVFMPRRTSRLSAWYSVRLLKLRVLISSYTPYSGLPPASAYRHME